MVCKSLLKHRLALNAGKDTIKIGVGIGENRKDFEVNKTMLKRCTEYFRPSIESEPSSKGFIFLPDEKPEAFEDFLKWLNTGKVDRPCTGTPGQSWGMLEDHLLHLQFDFRIKALIDLYVMAERFGVNDLMNKSIDTIQDAFFEYGIVAGVVFDRVFAKKVFTETKENSKLRELCIAANVLYLDRGCSVVMKRHLEMSKDCPGYLEYTLNWIAKNFHLIGKRADNPYDCQNPRECFNIFNRKCTCTCLFHVHDKPDQAHYNHETCVNRIRSCQCRCDGE